MALASFQLDPNAASFTDNQIVDKVNAASNNITRAGSVGAAARPLVAGEVSVTELSASAAKDNLDALADTARGYVKTGATTGEFPVIAIQREADGKLGIDYDDVAVV